MRGGAGAGAAPLPAPPERGDGRRPETGPAGEQIAPGRVLLDRLGGGVRYDVHLAWDERLRALVVVKLIRPALQNDGSTWRSLAAEAAMLEGLNHPVVPRLFDVRLDGDRPHLCIEHVEGPRLSTLLRRYGPLDIDQLVPLAVQICSALHYLSTEAVVHLDVKPSNIVMAQTPRLIDFSVAKTTREAFALRHPVGTDAYMAPEQCDPLRLGPVSEAADMWGLGATLYEAVTARKPFSEDPAVDTGWPQLETGPSPVDDQVPRVIGEPIMQCLSREPRDRPRPGEIGDLYEALLQALPRSPRLGAVKAAFHPRVSRR